MNNKIKNKKGESYRKKAQELESRGEFFSSAFYYKNALKMYRESGDSENQKICKSKMLEVNKKAACEFKTIEIEQGIPRELLERDLAYLNELMSGDLLHILKNIALSPIFFPKFKVVMDTANKSMPLSVSLANNATFDENGNIVRGSDDGQQVWRMQMYEIDQNIRLNLYLKITIKSLISMGKLNKKELLSFFENSDLLPKKYFKMIKPGIEAFFKEDYVSFLHILVPRLESLFLYLSKGSGIDVVSINSGKEISTQTKNLSEVHLESRIFNDVWGEDFCEQLNFVLFRQLGYKLRHKIAHGEISFKECNFLNASLILYFYIVMLLRVENKNKTKGNKVKM